MHAFIFFSSLRVWIITAVLFFIVCSVYIVYYLIPRMKKLYALYILILSAATVYSYSLIDLNLTLFNHPLWTQIRNTIIQLGYFHRDISFVIYSALIIALFILHGAAVKKSLNPIKLSLMIGLITLLSYPFLSHDFFNYLFDAKILTFYHKNPYLYKALDFPWDPNLRFMHWVHRPYPYGPIFLGLSAISSFLSFGKFILSFFFLKLTYTFFYIVSVHLVNRINKKWALLYAAHPLVIIEGLINAHNDFIALSLALIGLYFLIQKQKTFLGFIMMLFSFGIKYMTAPLVLMRKNMKSTMVAIIFAAQLAVIILVSVKGEIQPWYFLVLFAFVPFLYGLLNKLALFFAGLLFSYYPYIYLGGWDTPEKIQLKHIIIFAGTGINLIYLSFNFLRKKSLIR